MERYRSPEQKNLPFPTDREEPEKERKETANPREADERARMKKMHGEGAEGAALTSQEVKKKKAEQKKAVDELRAEIRRMLGER